MYYLVMMKSHNKLPTMDEEHLTAFKKGIEAAIEKGTITAAFTKVGGGIVLIVDSPSNAQLTLELRKHFITDAEVLPLVRLVDLLDAHIEHRKTGAVAV
jgi:hypothetical protein